MNFYTSVIEFKNKLLVRGVTNGKSYINRFNYQPTLYQQIQNQNIRH